MAGKALGLNSEKHFCVTPGQVIRQLLMNANNCTYEGLPNHSKNENSLIL